MKKCAIVSGAFKDVFSPDEACNVIKSALPHGIEAVTVPFCDGGEYTYDVLLNTGRYSEVFVDDVVNPYYKLVRSKYLVSGDEAHIVSSEIIRLFPEDDKEKNPLLLTDYGLGQLLKHAVDNGTKHIFLYLGGTSTVCFGMGFVQALGVRFYNHKGELIDKPLCAEDICKLSKYYKGNVNYSDYDLTVVCDGDARSYEMRGINSLKISAQFESIKEKVLDELELCRQKVLTLTEESDDIRFGGAAGGILYGAKLVFSPRCVLGGEFIKDLLDAEKAIAECDYVITGEGRYDNSACGKTPIFVSGMARKYGKKIYLICGQVDGRLLNDAGLDVITATDCPEIKDNGLEAIITCQRYYGNALDGMDYKDKVCLFKKMTPVYLKEIFGRFAL